MFCKDGADVLDRDGAQRLTGHLKQAVALVGLQAAGAPGAAELARLFFPGGQGRADTIDCKTFVDLWNSKRHIMLHAIQHGAIVEPEHAEARQSLSEATSRKKPAAVGRNLDPARSLARRERAQLRFSTRNAARAKEDVMRKDQEKYAGHNAGKLILSDKAKEANHKMMLQRVNKVATQKVMLELMETTQLSYADLSEIRAEFAFAFADRWKAEPLPVSETGAPKHAFRVQHAPGPAETRKPGLTMSMGRLKRIPAPLLWKIDLGSGPWFGKRKSGRQTGACGL
ncbi:hypothetical protein M885DRAFT_250423 [Pelagophyceae sp. CCMP2097]|nr:hypothetical protein M885DRAFT_250423 [Pelagophyceae sp. CCMP2097]